MVASTLGSGPGGTPPSPTRKAVTTSSSSQRSGGRGGSRGSGDALTGGPRCRASRQVRDDLGQVDRRADAGLGGAHEGHRVDGAVSGEARGYGGVAVGRDRESDRHV